MNYKTLMHISLYFFFFYFGDYLFKCQMYHPHLTLFSKTLQRLSHFFSFVGVYSWKEEADIKEAQTVQFNK